MSKNTFYVTTPIFYPTGKIHTGHFYSTLAADVLSRWNRLLGREVFFQTGTDEHGQKVKEYAQKEGKDPLDYVNEISKQFNKMKNEFDFTYDYFFQTTNEEHKKFIQGILQKTFDNGDIYKSKYIGLYCVGCERYYTEKELVDEKICPIHKKECEVQEDENYFFRLSKYQDKLLKFYKDNPEFISPKSKQKEIINRVEEGLEDISISRNKKKLDWGIEFPFDTEHVTYVWFDALYNYFSSTKFLDEKEEFWPANIHIMGHDITWFHTVYWPAFLMSIGEELPKKVFSHGLILDKEGHKMSKSLGNVVDPYECRDKYGLDELKFYLLSAGTFGDDFRFSFDSFIEKINNDLNNDLGNLVSRVHSMTGKYFEGEVPKVGEIQDVDYKLLEKLNIFEEFNKNIQDLKFNIATEILWNAIRETNAYINEVSPWKEQDKDRLSTIMNILCSAVILFGKYAQCIMPNKAKLIFKQFNFKDDKLLKLEFLEEGHKLAEKENIFTKVKKEEEEVQKKTIIFDFDGVIHDTSKMFFEISKEVHNSNLTEEEFKDFFNGNVHDHFKSDPKGNEEFFNIQDKLFNELKIEKEIERILKELKNSYNLFIVTSNKEEVINKYFINNKLESLFQEILGFETHKSKEEKFKVIFSKYNMKKEDCIFITDTLGDILEANKVKVKTIAVEFGFHERERLEKANPLKIISKFKEIPQTVEDVFSGKVEGFPTLNLKVGKIVDVKDHPEAEKLFIEKIDIGEEKPRQILSGLKGDYTKEDLLGLKVIVVANLKPAKLRGEMSEGMLLAAEETKEFCGIITSDEEIGSNLEWNGIKADNPKQITVDDFFKIKMNSEGDKITHKDKEITVNGKSLKALRGITGRIR